MKSVPAYAVVYFYSLHPVNVPAATVRTDPAPGFQALKQGHSLDEFNISRPLVEAKNMVPKRKSKNWKNKFFNKTHLVIRSLQCHLLPLWVVSTPESETAFSPLMKCGFSKNSSRISNYTLLMIILLQVGIVNA